MPLDTLHAVLALASLAASGLSAIVVWGFATGRWTKGQEAGQQTAASDLARLERRMDGEHAARKDFTDRINGALGKLSERVTGLERVLEVERDHANDERATIVKRLDGHDEKLAHLQRQIDRGNGAPV